MNQHTMPRKNPITSFTSKFVLAAAALALSACDTAPAQQIEPPLAGASIGGDFELTGANGEQVSWDDFEGQYRIVYFGFTFCPDICPTDVQRMSQGLMQFEQSAPELGAKITPIFVSVDPERDTPEIVGEFASNFHPRLIGLTGTPEQIKDAAGKFAVFYSRGEDTPGGGYLVDHSAVVYLFSPEGDPLATLPTDQGPEAVAAELAKWVS